VRADVCLPLIVGNPEGNYIIPGARGDIIYRRINEIELSMDAYAQKRGDRRPAVIVIHGGGLESGGKRAFIGQFLEILTRAGYNWFSIDYRLGGIRKYNDALDDLRSAIAFIRCHSKELRIDPDRIALLGEDVGANLAASLASEKALNVKAVVMIGGLHNLEKPSILSSSFIVHGTSDRESPAADAEAYCRFIRNGGGSCDYLPVEGGIHRPENWLPSQWGYKEKLISWLDKRMGLSRPDHSPYLTNLKKDIVFSRSRNLKLDAYIPSGPGPFPAVIIVHGGGWEAGDKVTYVTPLFEPLARAGFAWFSIDYRLTPMFRHEDQLEDLREAIHYLRNNAGRYRIDQNRIAIIGESASGQMVAQIATEGEKDIAAAVSFYGVYDFLSMAGEITPRSIPTRLFGIKSLDDEARRTLRRYSPLFNVGKNTPPLLLICGTKDGLLTQHQAFEQKLKDVGARYEAYIVEGAPHGIENWEGRPEWIEYKKKLVDWLKTRLKK
jgi:alpha-L-fucosidase 2